MLKFRVIDIQGQLRIKFISTNSWSWTLSFTCADVEEAELIPEYSSSMCFNWSKTVFGPVAV